MGLNAVLLRFVDALLFSLFFRLHKISNINMEAHNRGSGSFSHPLYKKLESYASNLIVARGRKKTAPWYAMSGNDPLLEKILYHVCFLSLPRVMQYMYQPLGEQMHAYPGVSKVDFPFGSTHPGEHRSKLLYMNSPHPRGILGLQVSTTLCAHTSGISVTSQRCYFGPILKL